VTGEENVITADTNDYGLITVVANVAGSASIAVADALYTYPQGTYAGFVIQDMGLLLEADLFSSLIISTYNNGVLQESKSGSDLIDLALIILFISDEPGRYNVGFKTTLPFDEVRITVGSLVTAINLVRVYGAFVDTRASSGGNLFCNDGPLAQPDVASIPEDMPVTITVLANDTDSDNPLGTPTVSTAPTHGTTMVNGNGTITYTPNPNYFGPDQFIYTLCDPQPLCDTALVKITVTPVDDAPFAQPDVATTPEDNPVTITVLANDSDIDNPLGTPTVSTAPTHGMTTVNGDGTITYTPNPNYSGPDQFIYTLCDPTPLCDTALVKITVTPVNDAPLAEPDVATVPEDNPVTITVLTNDSDPDNPLGAPTVSTAPTHGMTTVNGDGTITYTPDPDFVGPDTFIYTLCDPQPLCDTALVTVFVSPQRDTVTYTIPENGTQQACADDLTTFSEPATSISTCDLPSHGTLMISGAVSLMILIQASMEWILSASMYVIPTSRRFVIQRPLLLL